MQIVTYALSVGINKIPLMAGKRLIRTATTQGTMLSISYGNVAGQEIRLGVNNVFAYEPYTPIIVDDGDYLSVNVSAATLLSIGYVE